MRPESDKESSVAVKPSTDQPSRKDLLEGVILEPDPRNVVRSLLRPVKTHFEEQNHELQKVGKIELPWNKTQ